MYGIALCFLVRAGACPLHIPYMRMKTAPSLQHRQRGSVISNRSYDSKVELGFKIDQYLFVGVAHRVPGERRGGRSEEYGMTPCDAPRGRGQATQSHPRPWQVSCHG